MRSVSLALSLSLLGCPQNQPTEQKTPTSLAPTNVTVTPPNKDPLASIKDIPSDLRRDWLAKDAVMIPLIVAALPVQEQDTPATLLARFGSDPTQNTAHDLGFGGARHSANRPGGYTSCHLSLLALNDTILDATLTCRGSDEAMPLLKALYQAPLTLSEDQKTYRYHYTSKEGEAALFAAVSKELGAVSEVAPPKALVAAYQTLRTESLTLGTHCGAGGSPPKGRSELDAIVAAKRPDLLRQLLRGISPEGRVYAIEGLRRLEKSGVTLSALDLAAIEKLSALPTKLTTCHGCMEEKITATEYLHPVEPTPVPKYQTIVRSCVTSGMTAAVKNDLTIDAETRIFIWERSNQPTHSGTISKSELYSLSWTLSREGFKGWASEKMIEKPDMPVTICTLRAVHPDGTDEVSWQTGTTASTDAETTKQKIQKLLDDVTARGVAQK